MNVLFWNRLSSIVFSFFFATAMLGGAPKVRAEHHVLGRLDPYQNCRLCHGNDLQGGIGRSCYTCHDRLWPGGDEPPLADAGGPYAGEARIDVVFDGSRSVDIDGAIFSYLWDFGDGSVGTEVKPAHTYENAGTYFVTLTVTDDSGHTDTTSTAAEITASTLNLPPSADAAGPYTGAVGRAVQFDGSASTDVDGTIVSYAWDFGDGNTGTGPSPTHDYAGVGFFMVQLTVTDDGGATDVVNTAVTISLASNQPPDVDPGGPYSGTIGQGVQFDGSNTSDPDGDDLVFIWDFGDGSQPSFPSASPLASHTYSKTGTFTARVIVSDGGLTPVMVDVVVTITEGTPGIPLPTSGDTWAVQVPLQQTEFTLSWQDLGGILLVLTTHADGQTSLGIGLTSDDLILWMDMSGAVFFGNVNYDAGTMRGIMFDDSNGSSIWLGERLQAI